MADKYKEVPRGQRDALNERWWYAYCAARGVDAEAVDAGTATLDTRNGVAVFPPITRGPYAQPVAEDASGSLFVVPAELEALHGSPVTVRGQGRTVDSAPDASRAAKWDALLERGPGQ